jgi:hypothetical protein
LATFLAAFFFFFAMEMAPCHEHPEKVLTSAPPDALREGSERRFGDVLTTITRRHHVTDGRVVDDARENCQEKLAKKSRRLRDARVASTLS